MSEHPVFPIAQEVTAILDELSIPYMLMGGLAVRFWAIPRPTYDVDLTILADDSQVSRLVSRLEHDGYSIPPEVAKGWRAALSGMRKITVRKFLDRDSWRIDLFLVTTEYQAEAFRRRRIAKLLGRDVWTITAEDLILHKLIAGRERDLVDVSEILQLTEAVDLPYLRQWASRLGLAPSLKSGSAGVRHETGIAR